MTQGIIAEKVGDQLHVCLERSVCRLATLMLSLFLSAWTGDNARLRAAAPQRHQTARTVWTCWHSSK